MECLVRPQTGFPLLIVQFWDFEVTCPADLFEPKVSFNVFSLRSCGLAAYWFWGGRAQVAGLPDAEVRDERFSNTAV